MRRAKARLYNGNKLENADFIGIYLGFFGIFEISH